MELLKYAGDVATQVAIMLVLLILGFVITKFKVIKAEGVAGLTELLFCVVTPAVIIEAFTRVGLSGDTAMSLLIMAGCSFLIHMIGLIMAYLFFRKNKTDTGKILKSAVVFSNCGYMSLPLAKALIGAEGVFLVSVYVAVFNLVMWTVGLRMFSGKISFKKALLTPGVLGFAAGLLVFFLRLPIPGIIEQPLSYIAGLNTPVAMLIIGFYLSKVSLRITKRDGGMYISILFRLVIVPLISLAVLYFLGVRGTLLLAVMIPAAAPVAGNVMIFSAKLGGDNVTAAKIVPISTLLSMITIPVILALANYLAV